MFRYHLQFADVGSYALVFSIGDFIEAALSFHYHSWHYECLC
jgi:hypothetical protein